MVIATNLTSICCAYKEKIVYNYSYRRTQRSIHIFVLVFWGYLHLQYIFRQLQYLTQIVKKKINSKQIIQIFKHRIIDFFRHILVQLIFHNIFYLFYIQCNLNDDQLTARCLYSQFSAWFHMEETLSIFLNLYGRYALRNE